MGAPVTQNTKLGKRAKQVRAKVRALLLRVETTPPEGVVVGVHGGKNHLTPIGWLGRDLGNFALERSGQHKDWYCWTNPEGPVKHLSSFVRGGNSRHKQLTVIEAWLPHITAKLDTMAPASADEGQVLSVRGSSEAAEAPAAPERHLRVVEDEPAVLVPPVAAQGDPELHALAQVNQALLALADDDARKRVLKWAGDKFGA